MTYFPHAVHVAQHDELRHAWWPDRWTARAYAFGDYAGGRHYDFLELSGDTDLFRDGTLTLVRTAGHTPGHLGVILDLDHHGRIALMGDAAHLQQGLDRNVPVLGDWNTEEKMLTYGRLRALSRAGIRVFLSHDPDRFAALPRDGEFWDRPGRRGRAPPHRSLSPEGVRWGGIVQRGSPPQPLNGMPRTVGRATDNARQDQVELDRPTGERPGQAGPECWTRPSGAPWDVRDRTETVPPGAALRRPRRVGR